MAMTKEQAEVVFEKLHALQDVLAKKIGLEKEISEIPKLLTTQEELLTRLKKQWIEKDEEYVAAKQQAGEYGNLLFLAESTKEKAEKHMELTNTQREYENLDREIRESLEKEQQYRRDLSHVEQHITELNEQMQQDKALMDQQEAELTERRANVVADISDRKQQLVQLEQQEKEITEGLDQELLFKFGRIVRKKGGRGIVTIKGGVCSSCHMILPSQFANDVKNGKEIVSCPYCSSLLCYEESEEGEQDYLSEETAGALADLNDLDEEEFDEEEEVEEEDEIIDFEE
ncbi:MAG: C4-type zinc ribbon domain-containing protein [Spirochaetaceae bacterium]|jgi:predicted  nucleic acid-binding Zn-ribbon protein|nr:C4-type zinc ribbon domain-containing protein [Spirochaetaceae bacterium]